LCRVCCAVDGSIQPIDPLHCHTHGHTLADRGRPDTATQSYVAGYADTICTAELHTQPNFDGDFYADADVYFYADGDRHSVAFANSDVDSHIDRDTDADADRDSVGHADADADIDRNAYTNIASRHRYADRNADRDTDRDTLAHAISV
jgi:hypothetical protein